MIQVTNQTILIIICFVLAIIFLKFLGKSLYRVVALLVMVVIGLLYTYFYTDFFVEHKNNKIVQKIEQKIKYISVIEYQKQHCLGKMLTKTDSITCECIVSPVVNDMIQRLNEEEIKALEKDKPLYLKELMISLKNTQKDIQFQLKERNAIYLWNKLVLNLKEGKGIGED